MVSIKESFTFDDVYYFRSIQIFYPPETDISLQLTKKN